MVLEKSPADFFFCFYTYSQKMALPRYLIAPPRRLDLLTAPQAPTWISASPERRQNTASPPRGGGSFPFSLEQNAGVPFSRARPPPPPPAGEDPALYPQGSHSRGREQQQARRSLTPAGTKPEAPRMTYRVCRQGHPGPCPRRQRAPIPGSLRP